MSAKFYKTVITHQAGLLFLVGSLMFWFGYKHWQAYLIYLLVNAVILLRNTSYLKWLSLNAGFVYALLFGYLFAAQALDKIPTGSQLIRGSVDSLISQSNHRQQFRFTIHELNYAQVSPLTVRVSCEQLCDAVRAGQEWQFLVSLKPPTSTYNPDSFDMERWLMSQSIQARAFVKQSDRNKHINTVSTWLSFRQALYHQIRDSFRYDDIAASVAALLIGYRDDLSRQQRTQLRESGLSHLIAISGLHVSLAMLPGIVLGSLLWGALGIHTGVSKQPFQMTVGLITATAYAFISGFDQPAQRALFMLIIMVLLQLRVSYATGWQRLSLAIALMLIIDPRAILDMSFWLTTLVTAVILFGMAVKAQQRMSTVIYLQLLLAVIISAFQLFIFSEYSLFSLAQNLWAIPFISLVLLPTGLVWLLLSQLHESLAILNTPYQGVTLALDFLVYYFWYVLDTFNPFNRLALWHGHIAFSTLIPLIIGLSVIWLTALRPVIVCPIMVCAVLLNPTSSQTGLTMTVFDVGQGTALAIEVEDQLLIYDSGNRYEEWVVFEYILPIWLMRKRHEVIAYYVESHADLDHSGGSDWLISEYRPEVVYHSYSANRPTNVHSKLCTPGTVIDMSQANVTILSPPQDTNWSDNDSSCVLLLEYGGVQILLTGDIERAAEARLLRDYPHLTVDVLLVPHHGSKTSSSPALLKQLQPTIAINTSGHLNRFRLPHPSVTRRYEQMGSQFYDTADHGQITLNISPSGQLNIHSSRQQNPALWRRN